MAATALLLGPDVSITVSNLYLTQLQLKIGIQVLLTNTPQGVIPPQTTNVGTHPVACQYIDGGVAWSIVHHSLVPRFPWSGTRTLKCRRGKPGIFVM